MNAGRLKLPPTQVRFVRSDLFEKITGEFDLIVANLPYIPSSELPGLSREVHRDPVTALDGGADGLDIIHRLIQDGAAHLSADGTMALELHHDQSAAVMARLAEAGYQSILAMDDLARIPRFVFAIRPEVATASSEPLLPTE